MFFPCYRNCFVFRNPTGSVRNVFLQPFHMNVWYCIIVVGIFVIGTTSFITYLEEKRSGKIRFVNLYTSHKRCSAILYDVFFLSSSSSSFYVSFPPISFRVAFYRAHFPCITLHFDVLLLCVDNTKSWVRTKKKTHTATTTTSKCSVAAAIHWQIVQVLRRWTCSQHCWHHRHHRWIDQRSTKTMENWT